MSEKIYFKRKVYDELTKWKNNYADNYACLLEGARRVGKSTIAENFAKKNYESYIKIDFAHIQKELLEIFEDIGDLDRFFLRLQNITSINLVKGRSLIIFDEIQLYPLARQAIKYLVLDGRYHYIETGSLISIKKNVKDILIPSEEHKINVYPMDYEEFCWAIGKSTDVLEKTVIKDIPLGESTNRKLMKDFRLYMAVGGMPQAVETYINTNNLSAVDNIKRDIINLYKNDLKKIDPSGRLTDIYNSIPSQLALKRKRFNVQTATGKRRTTKDEERLFELIDSKIVLPCYNVTHPDISLSQTRENDNFKLYLSDVGLFITMLFDNGNGLDNDIYNKLLSDSLPSNLGYLYENVVAQMLVFAGKDLYFHSWKEKGKTHSNEIDFLVISKNKLVPIEVKSSAVRNHKSIDLFSQKYSKIIGRRLLLSQKDLDHKDNLEFKPIYYLPFILKNKLL